MKFEYEGIQINYTLYEKEFSKKKPALLILHGFTGSSLDFKDFATGIADNFNPVGLDLPGFGESDSPEEIDFYTATFIRRMVDTFLSNLNITKAVIFGYSMGGRVALTFYNSHPEKVSGLILESTSPGLLAEDERELRKREDMKFARFIRKHSIEEFVKFWESIPLFMSQKSINPEVLENQHIRRLKNDKTGLSNSLIGFGTGSMPSVWNCLETMSLPVLLITGELDSKYKEIAEQMASKVVSADLRIIKNCGHNVHLEKPADFVNLVNDFYINFFSSRRNNGF